MSGYIICLISAISYFWAIADCASCPTDLKLDVGRLCDGTKNVSKPVRRWYFDQEAEQCKSFQFMGCGGNDNRFVSLIECQRSCNVLCPFGKPLSNVTCTEKVSCPTAYHCNTVDNETACCPDQIYICAEPMDVGIKCDEGKARKVYYNDMASGRCTIMDYHGCGGNMNNFANLEECEQLCRPKCKEYLQKVYHDLNLNIKL